MGTSIRQIIDIRAEIIVYNQKHKINKEFKKIKILKVNDRCENVIIRLSITTTDLYRTDIIRLGKNTDRLRSSIQRLFTFILVFYEHLRR
ncbi:hypothetical protein RCL_jg26311.t1 [Rhizophagus clarus]|uniref:Uncharacterized protein n=1 Tax=Rhizophagus clarus TaxID=94130 RepID=A0A8H3KWY1_9GLOM|nr:hypothetical protein RCL_jg26311.t1 [Rhizophagus clarus]